MLRNVTLILPNLLQPMVLILDGSAEHGAHIRSKAGIRFLKAFAYIERVVKSDFFFSERNYLTS